MKQTWGRILVVVLALAVGASTGVQTPVYADDGHAVASLAPVALDFGFHYEKDPILANVELETDLETRDYHVYKVSFPSTGNNGQDDNLVTALYYQSKLPGKRKLVVVLPIWGTHTYPSRKITKSLTKYSDGEMNVLRILGEHFLFDWEGMRAIANEQEFIAMTEQMVKRVQTHVIDIRRAIDWAEVRPETDRNRIGIIGFSLGATVASLVAENEPRIGASVLAMGGANINEMFATCFGRAEEARNLIIGRLGWTRDIFEQKLAGPLMPINPASFPGKVDPKRVIIFDAAYDTCIPESG
ncbi:MAG: dienelactone hydrolase family protein, partial [Acidiferrobacterales bacterium]|nr:dienelactone hydrolase family protein [Acidiferrobacterales bacterium]